MKKFDTPENRRVSTSGSVTIPAKMRRRHGISPGDGVIVEMTPEGYVLIKPWRHICGICEKEVATASFMNGVPVCKNCLTEAAQLSRGLGISTAKPKTKNNLQHNNHYSTTKNQNRRKTKGEKQNEKTTNNTPAKSKDQQKGRK